MSATEMRGAALITGASAASARFTSTASPAARPSVLLRFETYLIHAC